MNAVSQEEVFAEATVANPSAVVGGSHLGLRVEDPNLEEASVPLSSTGGLCEGPVSGVSSDIQMALSHMRPLY